ncbi:MAG: TCR/Tet family MFS transporter [Phycisphaeraceae bacterium]|nr:MAG: TCR/Tet family MFS transporter [Phycisphaeraceae bacterium]
MAAPHNHGEHRTLPATRPARPAAIRFIFITLLLDVLGFGLLIPVGPRLVQGLMNGGHGATDAEVTPVFGVLMSTFYVMMFLFAPLLGAISDRVGRRPVILVSLLGSGLDYFAQAFAPTLAWLFVTRAINGLTGASFTVCSAYVADVTPPDKRAAGFGMIGAAFGLGFVLGPLIGGYLGSPDNIIPFIGPGDVHYPFIAAGCLSIINWLYGLMILPESLPRERRSARIEWRKANPIGMLPRLASYPKVASLAASLFLLNLAMYALHATWAKYTEHRYGWGTETIGLSLFTVGLGAAIVQGGLTRRIVPWLGEPRSLLIGLGIGVLAYLGYAFAPHGWMIFVVIAFASLGGIAQPASQAIITKAVRPDEQGAIQGAITSLGSLAGIFGPAAGGWVFGYFISDRAPFHLPGASFVMSSALSLLGAIVAAYALYRHRDRPPTPAGHAREG